MIDLSALAPAAILLAVMLLPVLPVVVVVFFLKRAEAREDRRSPLNDKLLHQPGAQARRKAEETGDEIMARTALLLLIGPLGLLTLLLPRVRWSQIRFDWTDWLIIGSLLAFVFWQVRAMVRFRRKRRAWLNGMRGEMASAQALDRLRARGCEVFHDLPGKRGNIDHVVVAPNAVFAVETKWRSKRGPGSKAAEVWFDGETLQFPSGFRDRSPVEQARACAAELTEYLTGRTGELVHVVPVVALPGWYAKNRAEASRSGLLVINPKMSGMLTNQPGSRISPAQRNRIISALVERYPELDP